MCYFFQKEENLYKNFIDVENRLFDRNNRIKFERTSKWRNKHLTNKEVIYALFKDEQLIYIGETGDLKKRMSDITRTANHTLRKKIGGKVFNVFLEKDKGKFNDYVEEKIDKYFDEKLYLSFVEVNFGRLEIETFLVTQHQDKIFNSLKKRKPIYNQELIISLRNKFNQIKQ